MNLAKHCELCENRVFSMVDGTSCGLTGQKPAFTSKCPDIKFGDNHIEKIKKVNIEHFKIAQTKGSTIGNFVVFFSASIAVMLAGYIYGKIAWNEGVISNVPLMIMGAGFLVLPLATGPLVKYRQHMSVLKKKKNDLDSLLSSYNITYDIDIEVDEDLHGNKDYEATVRFSRVHYR